MVSYNYNMPRENLYNELPSRRTPLEKENEKIEQSSKHAINNDRPALTEESLIAHEKTRAEYNRTQLNVSLRQTTSSRAVNKDSDRTSDSVKELYFNMEKEINTEDYTIENIRKNFENNNNYNLEITADDNSIVRASSYDIRITEKDSGKTIYITYPTSSEGNYEIKMVNDVSWTKTTATDVEKKITNEFGEEEYIYGTEITGQTQQAETFVQTGFYDHTGILRTYNDNVETLLNKTLSEITVNPYDETNQNVINSNWEALMQAIDTTNNLLQIRSEYCTNSFANYNSYTDEDIKKLEDIDIKQYIDFADKLKIIIAKGKTLELNR